MSWTHNAVAAILSCLEHKVSRFCVTGKFGQVIKPIGYGFNKLRIKHDVLDTQCIEHKVSSFCVTGNFDKVIKPIGSGFNKLRFKHDVLDTQCRCSYIELSRTQS